MNIPELHNSPPPPAGVTTCACCSCCRSSGVCRGLGEDWSYALHGSCKVMTELMPRFLKTICSVLGTCMKVKTWYVHFCGCEKSTRRALVVKVDARDV